MKMKILLVLEYVFLISLRIFLDVPLMMLLVMFLPLLFFALTRDKANTIRVMICALAILGVLPVLLSSIPLIISLVLNDESLRRMRRWKLIVFTGIDGSGKSTHAKETALWLKGLGVPVTYYHFFRHPLVTLFSLAKRKIVKVSEDEVRTYSPGFRLHLRRGILPKIRPIAQYIDNWAYIGLRLLFHMLKGEWVIADRYFYDYYIRFKCLGYPMPRPLEKVYLRLVPRPHLLIVFDVDPKISFQRRGAEHPLWYYYRARKAFFNLAKRLHAPILNTERDFDVVQEDINNLIRTHLLGPKEK